MILRKLKLLSKFVIQQGTDYSFCRNSWYNDVKIKFCVKIRDSKMYISKFFFRIAIQQCTNNFFYWNSWCKNEQTKVYVKICKTSTLFYLEHCIKSKSSRSKRDNHLTNKTHNFIPLNNCKIPALYFVKRISKKHWTIKH